MATAKQVLDSANNAIRAGDSEAYEVLFNEYMRLRDEERIAKYGVGVEPVEEDTGVLGNLAKGFGSGAVGLVESAALGGATLLEEETELKAREKIQAVGDALSPEGGDPDSLAYKFGSGLGSIAAFLPTALLGKAALPAAGVLAVGAGSGEASERARAYGATEEERGTASVQGAFVGVTEIIPLGRLAKKLKVPFLSDALDTLGKKMGKRDVSTLRGKLQSASETMLIEGAQETAAAVLQNLVEQGYNPERLLIDAGVAEEGAIGGSAGATLQVLVDLFAGRRIKKAKAAKAKEKQKQEDFDIRQESAREKRSDPQGDMFADELNEAEEAELARMEEEEKASKKKEDEVEFESEDGKTFKVKDPEKYIEEDLARMELEEQRVRDEKERKEKELFEDRVERRMRVDGVSRPVAEMAEREAQEKRVRATDDTKTIDLVDRIAEEEELDRMQAEEDADKEYDKGVAEGFKTLDERRKAEKTRVRKTGILDRRRDVQQRSKTVVARKLILNKVLEEDTTGDFNVIKNNFAKALKNEGFRDTSLSKSEDVSLKTNLRRKREAVKKEEPKAGPPIPGSAVQQGQPIKTLNEEPDDVGEQTTRTPDTGTARDSVPSDTEVVGQQRAESAKESGRPVERGLDDSVSDTGRPDGRARGAKPSLKQQDLPLGKPTLRSTPRKPAVLDKPLAEDVIDTPVLVNRAEGQPKVIKYKASQTLVPEHKKLNQDKTVLENIVLLDTEKKFKDETKERRIPSATKEVAIYLQKFDTPLDGVLNAVYDLADPNRTTLKDADIKVPGLTPKKAAAVIKWASNNLSQDTNKAIRKKIRVIRAAKAKKDSDAAKPTQAQQAVANKAKKSKKRDFVSFDEFKRQRAAQQTPKAVDPAESAVPAGKKPITTRILPTLKKGRKIRFRETTDALKPHANLENDMFVMDGVSNIKQPKSVSKTAPTGTAQNKTLNDLRRVTEYFSKFESPVHAITNYIHEKADPDRTQLFEGDAAGEQLKGLSGANTEAMARWINKNLSKETRAQIGTEVKRLRDQKNDAIRTEKKLLEESETTSSAEFERTVELEADKAARIAEEKRVEKEKKQKTADEQAAVTTADTSAVAEDTKKPASKKARAAKAKKIADDNVSDALNNPESDLTVKANFEKAKIHAKNSSKPKANLKAVEQKRKDQIEGKRDK
jgi:hypothetical protein